jgi:hypothetical protein
MSKLLKTRKDKEQFLDWLAVLESNAVPQATSRLQNREGFCCLGLACALLIPENKVITAADDIFMPTGRLLGEYPDCQPNAPRWLKDIDKHFLRKTGRTVSDMNDIDELSFPEIAKILRMAYAEELR